MTTCKLCGEEFEHKTLLLGYVDECDECSKFFYFGIPDVNKGLSDIEGNNLQIIKDTAVKEKLIHETNKPQIKLENKKKLLEEIENDKR